MFYYDNLVIHQKKHMEQYYDHMFYNLPRPAINWQYYTFPSTYVGSQNAVNVYNYLYSQSDKLKDLAKENSIFISNEHHSRIVETLIHEERPKFRKNFNIADTATVIYAHLGVTKEEIEANFKLVDEGVDQFLARFGKQKDIPARAIGAENLHIVVTATPEFDSLVQRLNSATKSKVKHTVVSDDTDRYSAIAVIRPKSNSVCF